MTVKPENVYALVVGIEKYQAGSEWDLNGPAKDALQFANWLLARDVKPEQIQLFLSPLAQNEGVLVEARSKGLTPASATREAIDTTIRYKLTSESSRGDLLYVFWGGHGIVTKTSSTTRRLLFADTDNTNKWNLNFNSLVEALSTFAFNSGFGQQSFLIDACANAYYQGLYQTIGAEAAELRFSTTGEQGKADQFILLASAEYEVATNESDVGTGRFSRAVLDELQGQSLLPDMEALAKRIQANCREQQHLEPVYRWLKGRGYEEEEDRSNQKGGVAPPKLPLSPGQQRKLQYLKNKCDDINRKIQIVEAEIGAKVDILDKYALENRLNILSEELDRVTQDIQRLEEGNE